MTLKYFHEIDVSLASYTWAETVQILRYDVLETDDEDILVYRIRISMPVGRILEMRERIVSSKRDETFDTTAYSFHWQNRNEKLIRRWDSVLQFPDLDAFPHHIHIGESDTVIPGEPIKAVEMLAQIDAEISNIVEKSRLLPTDESEVSIHIPPHGGKDFC